MAHGRIRFGIPSTRRASPSGNNRSQAPRARTPRPMPDAG